MKSNKRAFKKINNKFVLVIFVITMLLFGTSYALLNQDLALNGTINIYIEDEGNNLTVTNFNNKVDSVPISSFFGLVISGYRVVGITIKNDLHKTVDNWTIEFTSNRNAETTRPTNSKLSAYLNSENAYTSVSNSNGTVIVKGNDTLAPGESKTVYVFFNYSSFNNSFTFGTPIAYYTPPESQNNINYLARNARASYSSNGYDESSYNNCYVFINYGSRSTAGNMTDTTLYIYIANDTNDSISGVKFDVAYNNTNLSSLSSNNISILSNTESSASFICNDTIPSKTCKCYIVSGMKTSGDFRGTNISNVSYSNGSLPSPIEEPENTNNSEPIENTIEIIDNSNAITNKVVENANVIENTDIIEDTQNEIPENITVEDSSTSVENIYE